MYNKLTEAQKEVLIRKEYLNDCRSFQDIAEEHGTYANKVRRDAKRFNIPIRDKSLAQKNALKTGKHKHPTKGTKRDESTKSKIGMSVMGFWDGMSDADLDKRRQLAKQNWENMTEEQKEYMQKQANTAVRDAGKLGSKMEHFLLSYLLENGLKVDFHKEQTLSNTKLQIDLFLPQHNIAIEIDGPSHFLPVWGDDTLDKNIKYDQKKTGLILGKGWVLIRVKQLREFSRSRAKKLSETLLACINNIVLKYPDKDNRYIEIGD